MAQPAIDLDSERSEVERLYVDENLTLPEVMDAMKSTRGISASASTYQRKLREWGVRKHIKWSGPNGLGRTIKKRTRDGKGTVVLDKRGKLVSEEKMRRGIRRYASAVLSDSLQKDYDTPSPTAPEGLIVCSPLASGLGQSMDLLNGGSRHVKSPWNRFLESLRSLTQTNVDHGGIPPTDVTATKPDETQWDSPEMVLIQLYLLSTNQLYRTDVSLESSEIRDSFIADLLDRLGLTGLNLIKELLLRGDPITEAIRDRAFCCTIRLKRLDLLRVMIDSGVDLDANLQSVDWEKQTPLQYAAAIQDEDTSLEITRLFINHGASIDKSASGRPKETPLCLAITNNHGRVVDFLLNARASPGADALTLALKVYCRTEDDSIVQQLIKAGADINGRLKIDAPVCADVTLLGFAAIRKDDRLADCLIHLGADVDAIQSTECFRLLPLCGGPGHIACTAPTYTTPLGLAVAMGSLDVVQSLLVDGGAEINPLNIKGYRCPLLIACAQHQRTVAAMLLGDDRVEVSSAEENAMAMECKPTTLLACMGSPDGSSEDAELREELKRRGARIGHVLGTQSMRDFYVQGDLERSVEEGNVDRTIRLLEAGATQSRTIKRIGSGGVAAVLQTRGLLFQLTVQNGPDILSDAILSRHSSLARYLLDHGISIAGTHSPSLLPAPLDAAILRGEVGVIEALVKHQAPYTPGTLQLAIEATQAEEMLERLLPYTIPMVWRRADAALSTSVSVPSEDPAAQALVRAAELGRHRVFQMLLEAAKWGAECLGMALASTILFGRHSLIQSLLDAGASLQGSGLVRRATGGWVSAWDAALASKQVWIVEAFIKAGVDVNKRSVQTRHTPLEVAAKAGDLELTDALLTAGADIHAPAARDSGATPLQLAAVHNHVAMVRRLIEVGADVNAPGSIVDGRTALEGAAEHGHLDILHLLLNRGAGAQDMKEQYVRAMQFAEREGNVAAANLMRNYAAGADLDISISETMQL